MFIILGVCNFWSKWFCFTCKNVSLSLFTIFHFSWLFTFENFFLSLFTNFHFLQSFLFSTLTTQVSVILCAVWLRPQSCMLPLNCSLSLFTTFHNFHFSFFSLFITFYFSQPYTLHSVAQTPILDACSQEEIDRMSKEVKLKKLNCWISVYKW